MNFFPKNQDQTVTRSKVRKDKKKDKKEYYSAVTE